MAADQSAGKEPGTVHTPIDLFAYLSNNVGPSRALQISDRPLVLFTRMSNTEPFEVTTGTTSNVLMLHLSHTLKVVEKEGSRERHRVIVPGQTSYHTVDSPFSGVIWPSLESVRLSVFFSSPWMADVQEREIARQGTRSTSSAAWLGKWDPKLRELGMRLADALRSGAADRLLIDELTLGLAVALTCQRHGRWVKPHAAEVLAPERLRPVVDYMHAYLGEPIMLADLAAIAGLSVFHFCRSFKASVGITPHRYLIEMRLERARFLLATTVRPITEIALSLGFATPSAFGTAFRAHTGLTPTSFRVKNA